MEASHNIVVSVDAARARQGLAELQRQVQGVGQSLRGLSSQSGFQNLAAQVNASSSAFSNLARSLAAVSSASSRIASMSASGNGLANMSRGVHDAHNAVQGLTSALNPLNVGIAALSATIGAMSLSKFVSDTMAAGTSALNLRIAVDSVASGSGEAGRALAFIRKTALDLGQPLDVATKQFANFYTSARALGKTPETIENVWRGLSTAMSALHVSRQDQALFMRELQETYSMGKIDATRLIRSMSTHLPGLSASMQQAMGISGAKMHEIFKNGGLPVESWEKLATLLEKRYGSGVATALHHAQGAVISLSNSFELLKQQTFDQGLDAGFATLANTINSLIKPNIDSLSQTLGVMFRTAGAGAALFVTKLYEVRDSLTTVAQIIGGYAVISTAFRIAAAGAALLLSPLGLATGLALALQSQWESLASVFSGSDSAFKAGSNYIKNLTAGFIDFERAVRGGVKVWEMFKSLVGGSSFADAQKAAIAAAQQFDAGEYGKRDGNAYANALEERLKRIGDVLKNVITVPGLNLADEYKRLYAQTAPVPFESHGDHLNNQKRYDDIASNRDLSESLKKVRESLSPTNKALETYKSQLESIAKMRGKIDPLGNVISDEQIARMRSLAREKALSDGFPAVNKIQSLMDSIKLEQEALRNVGGNTAGEQIKIEREFLSFKRDMLRQHIELTKEEENAVRALLTARNQLERGGENGFSRWANQQKSGMEGINDSIGHGLDTVADGLAKIATTGKDIKATFRDMLRSIAADFIRNGIRSLMADGLKQMNVSALFGDNGLGANIKHALGLGQGVIDKANASIDDAAKSLASTVTPHMDVQAAVVNINGGIGGASGLEAFKPDSSIQDAIRPQAVGGIAPSNATAPLFSNDNALGALQEFKSNVRTGGLGNIPSNSVAEFGKGLVPSLGALPGFKDGLKSSAEGITKNSLAEFGKVINLQKLAPVAERAGLTSINDGSGNLASLAGRERFAWDFFKSKGYSDHDAAKILGNIKQESNFNPHSLNPGDSKTDGGVIGGRDSHGIAQWNKGRWGGLQHFAAQRGKPWHDYETQLGFMHHEIQSTPYYRNALRNSRDAGAFGHAYEGFGDNSAGTRSAYGNRYLHRFGDKSAELGKQLSDQTAKTTQEIQKQLQAQRALSTETEKSFKAIAETTQPLQSFDSGVSNLASNLSEGIPATDSFASSIQKLIEQLLSGLGGAGGGIGNALGGILGGLFSEGGYSTLPVASTALPASAWFGAPHFAEGGTTLPGGGIPSVLHENEAVIPLSRGREIPVRLEGDGVGGGSQTIVQNFSTNITARDHDSFRRNHSQVLESMQKAAARARVRNG